MVAKEVVRHKNDARIRHGGVGDDGHNAGATAERPLPSEFPDDTPMVDGRVRAIEQVGTNIWVGGRFTKVKKRDGTVLANVCSLAVFDSQTEQYSPSRLSSGARGPRCGT